MCVIFHSWQCLEPLKSFESTWQIEDFSSGYVLIPSKNRRGSKTKKRVKIGKYRVKIDRVRCVLGFYCYLYSLTHSLTHSLKRVHSNLRLFSSKLQKP